MTDTPAPAARPFALLLQEQRGGLLAIELTDALQDLVAAVTDVGKAGELTLRIKVTPAKGGGHLTVSDDVKVKKPEPVRAESIFYADEAHNLVREDPRQQRIPGLREVPAPTVKEA
jgi:hypothetical protein